MFRAQLLARPGLLQARLIGLRDHIMEWVRLQRLADERIVRVQGAALQERPDFPYVYETARLTSGGVYFTGLVSTVKTACRKRRAVFSVAAPVVQGVAVVVAVVVLRVDAEAFLPAFWGVPARTLWFLPANRWGFLAHRSGTGLGFDRGQRVLVQEGSSPRRPCSRR